MTGVPATLDARFRAAAAATGELDVAYDVLDDTPVGTLLVGVSERGLCRVHFDPDPERELDDLARRFGPRVLRSPSAIDRAKLELDEYFSGRRREFELDTDLSPVAPFQRLALHELARVPFGRVITYGALAEKMGRPRAARAVGGAMNRNPIPIVLPCHRVVGSNGSLVGYGGGLERKEALLRLEGALL